MKQYHLLVVGELNLPSLPFFVCDAKGQILRRGDAPGNMIEIQAHQVGEVAYVGIADEVRQFLDMSDFQLKQKRLFEISYDPDTHSLSNVPLGTLLSEVKSATAVVADEKTVELEFNLPGTYRILFYHYQYFPHEMVIEVPEPQDPQ